MTRVAIVLCTSLLIVGIAGIVFLAVARIGDHALLYTFVGIALVGALGLPSLANAIGVGVKYCIELAPWKKAATQNETAPGGSGQTPTQ